MELFLKLEAGYLGIAVFILVVTFFVSTRPFMPKGSYKKGFFLVSSVITTFILLHYFVTSTRIHEVEETFNQGGKVICESKAVRKVAQSVAIQKSNEWSLKDHMLSSPHYSRSFFTARCIKFVPIVLDK